MGDIHVNIYEDINLKYKMTLKETNPGVYKLDDPLADPDGIFLLNGGIEQMVMYAIMHLINRKKE